MGRIGAVAAEPEGVRSAICQQLSKYWNIYWGLIGPLSIGSICSFFLRILNRGGPERGSLLRADFDVLRSTSTGEKSPRIRVRRGERLPAGCTWRGLYALPAAPDKARCAEVPMQKGGGARDHRDRRSGAAPIRTYVNALFSSENLPRAPLSGEVCHSQCALRQIGPPKCIGSTRNNRPRRLLNSL